MFAMVVLTVIVGLIAVKQRFAGVSSGEVKIKYFQIMQGENVPVQITKTTRCFNNLFEVPVLFYAAGILYVSLGIDSVLGLVLAWGFVFFRCVLAFVHLTYNNVVHRMSVFWLALVCVLGLWVNLLVLHSL
jgi:hypothetical protein